MFNVNVVIPRFTMEMIEATTDEDAHPSRSEEDFYGVLTALQRIEEGRFPFRREPEAIGPTMQSFATYLSTIKKTCGVYCGSNPDGTLNIRNKFFETSSLDEQHKMELLHPVHTYAISQIKLYIAESLSSAGHHRVKIAASLGDEGYSLDETSAHYMSIFTAISKYLNEPNLYKGEVARELQEFTAKADLYYRISE